MSTTQIVVPRACPECSGNELWQSEVDSGAGWGPKLLPGLGSMLMYAPLFAVVCRRCGHVRFFAGRSALDKLPDVSNWQRIENPSNL